MVKIEKIEQGSIAEELKIQQNDILESINGKEVNDRLDYRFFQSGEQMELLIKRGK